MKCTGTLPCSFCLESRQRCVYDKNQGRRGPKPRRQPQERVIHELAPAPQPRDSFPSKIVSVGDSKWKPIEPVAAVDMNLCLSTGNENNSGLEEDTATYSDAESNTFDGSSSHSIPDSCTWEANLGEILANSTPHDGLKYVQFHIDVVFSRTLVLTTCKLKHRFKSDRSFTRAFLQSMPLQCFAGNPEIDLLSNDCCKNRIPWPHICCMCLQRSILGASYCENAGTGRIRA